MSVKVKSPLQRMISVLLCMAILMSFSSPAWAAETTETTTQTASSGISGLSENVEYVSLPVTIRDFAADGMLFEFNQTDMGSSTYASTTYSFVTESLSADYDWDNTNDNYRGFRIRTFETHKAELPNGRNLQYWYGVICNSDGSIKAILPSGLVKTEPYAQYMTEGCFSVWVWCGDGSESTADAWTAYYSFYSLVPEDNRHGCTISYDAAAGTMTVTTKYKYIEHAGRNYIIGDNNAFTLQRTDASDYVNNLLDSDSIPGTTLIRNMTSGTTPPSPVTVTLNSGALQHVYGANLRTDLVEATLDKDKNPVYTQATVDYLADLLSTMFEVPYTMTLGDKVYYPSYYLLGTKLFDKDFNYVGAGAATALWDLADLFRTYINGGLGTYADAKSRFDAGELDDPRNVDTYYEAAYYLLHSLWRDNATEGYSGNDGYGWNTWNYNKIHLVQTTNANGENCYVFNSGYDNTEYDPIVVNDGQTTGSGSIYNTQVQTITPAQYKASDGTYTGGIVYSNGVILPNARFDPLGTSGSGLEFGYGMDAGTYCELLDNYPDRGELFYSETNYHYTLEGHAKFIYYKDANQYFTFTGDDDVYLYINGMRVMDLGGAHSIAQVQTNLNDIAELCGLSDGMTYDFDFYYMERHGTAANFGIETNIQIVDSSMLTTKDGYQNGVSTGYNGYVNPYLPVVYEFGLENDGEASIQNLTFSDSTIGVSLTKDLIELNSLTKMDDLSVTLYGSGGTVKSSVAAGLLTEETLKTYLTAGLAVGEKIVIHGFSYKIDDAEWQQRTLADGSTSNWYFFNTIYTTATAKGENASTKELTGTSNWVVQKLKEEEMGPLYITKQLGEDASHTLLGETYTMQVLLDGKQLPVGTAYTVGTETKTVETAGQILVGVGQTAVIEGIAYGTAFQVSELISETDPDVYRATYAATNATADENGVTGTITEGAEARAVVINHTKPGSLVETDKWVTAADDPNRFTLTLESFVKGELTNVATTTPTDFVLVLDQSASMYAPAGGAGGYDNSAVIGELASSVAVEALDAEKAQHMGYYVAQSCSGRPTNELDNDGNKITYYDWFVVQNIGGKWYYVRVAGTSAPVSLDVANANTGSANEIGETLVRDTPIESFNYYQSGYGALYDAVHTFVDGLKNTGADHRVAVVGFAAPFYDAMEHFDGSGVYVDGKYYLYDTEYFEDAGGIYSYDYKAGPDSKYYLTAEQIAALPTAGAETVYGEALVSVRDNYDSIVNSLNAVTTNYWHTCPAAGLDMANQILAQTPANGRNRTVILFTDGVPTVRLGADYEKGENYNEEDKIDGLYQAHFYWTVAQGKDSALEVAYETKNTYGANIHTVGISGAGADELFLRGVSSDYPNAQSYPVTYTDTDGTVHSFEDDGERQPTKEEIRAGMGEPIAEPMFAHFAIQELTLTEIFGEILQSTTTLDLGSDAVLKEVLTDYFDLATGTVEDIMVYTAPYDGNGSYGDKVLLENAKVTLSSSDGSSRLDTIEVTGYDYAREYVSDLSRQKLGADGNVLEENYYGSKLIVEIQIKTREGFWGGNNVPTNKNTTAIYEKDGNLVDKFPEPQVNVPLSLTLESEDAVVYYGSDALPSGLLTQLTAGGMSVVIGDDGSLAPQAEWMDDFATLTWTGAGSPNGALSCTEPGDYTYSAKLVPNTDGSANTCTYPSNIAGSQVAMSGITAQDQSHVDVLIPIIPFEDSTIKQGETPDEDYFNTNDLVDDEIRWVLIDDITAAKAATAGEPPVLNFTYAPVGTLSGDARFYESDTKIDVTVTGTYGAADPVDLNSVAYFDWVTCGERLHRAQQTAIVQHEATIENQHEFWIHVEQESGLVTDKYVEATEDPNEFVLTLEAYAKGQVEQITVTKPADIILVLDHSGSMRTPAGASKVLYSGEPYDGTASALTKDQLETDKGQHRGYYIAWSTTSKNWFVMEYDAATALWIAYSVPSTESIVNTNGNYTEHTLVQSWSYNDLPDQLVYYKSQYAVLYDAMLEFVGDLQASGVEHNVAIVGFAGADSDGTRLYVGSSGESNSGFKIYQSQLYHENTTQARRDELYQLAMKNVQNDTEYAELLSNIELIETNYSFTCPTAGLQLANEVFTANAVDLAERDRIVVLFTDGIPNKTLAGAGTETVSQEEIYDEIVKKACETKTTYGAQVYSICTATLSGSRDFLNYSSSNYPNATSYSTPGTEASGQYFHEIIGFDALNNAFTTISQSTTSTTVALDETAILREVLTDYFVLNPDADVDVQIYTAAYNGNGEFAEPVLKTEADGFQYTLSSSDGSDRMDTIDVTGYDYHDEYLSETLHEKEDGSTTYGSKLIVKVRIRTRDGFWGGNNVPTNEAKTGIYDRNEVPVEGFPEPEVNVPITVDVVAKNKTIYYGGTVTAKDLIESVTAGGVEVTINDDGTFTPAEDWMNDYADLSWTAGSTKPGDSPNNLTYEDYPFQVQLTPKYDGSENLQDNPSNIAGNIDGGTVETNSSAETAKTDRDTGHVYILVPEITFKDSVTEFGTPADGYDYGGSDYVATEWVNMETDLPEGTVVPAPDETTKPTLTLTYTPEADVFIEDTRVEVTITSSNPDGDISSVTEFKWETCEDPLHGECGSIESHKASEADKHEFWIHVSLWINPDTVVIDYGLPVEIDPLANDPTFSGIKPTLVGIGKDADTSYTGEFGTANVQDEIVRYILNTVNGMEMNKEETFNYRVQYTVGEKSRTVESTITVIPATILYYEDNFVEFATYNTENFELITEGNVWTTDGSQTDAVQGTDRPGTDQIGADVDNIYGYDTAYLDSKEFSLNSAHRVTVDDSFFAEAVFTFWGTGFDVIALSGNTTGTITVDIYDAAEFETAGYDTELYRTYMVDTYYGYAYGPTEEGGEKVWHLTDSNDPNALYQVPVMKVDLNEPIDGRDALGYGRYTAVITVAYSSIFDHEQYAEGGKYDFWLDAIRIYDQANDGKDSSVIQNAYMADGEGWPDYSELRDMLIDANTFDSLNITDEVSGVIFIDGIPALDDSTASGTDGDVSDNITGKTAAITDYANFGPNNELYLAPGQAVSFTLNAQTAKSVHLALKSVGGTAKVKIYDADETGSYVLGGTESAADIDTATDLYYDITGLKDKTIVIYNAGTEADAILSITNIKVTYETNPGSAEETTVVFTVSRSDSTQALASLILEKASVEPGVYQGSLSMRRLRFQPVSLMPLSS